MEELYYLSVMDLNMAHVNENPLNIFQCSKQSKARIAAFVREVRSFGIFGDRKHLADT